MAFVLGWRVGDRYYSAPFLIIYIYGNISYPLHLPLYIRSPLMESISLLSLLKCPAFQLPEWSTWKCLYLSSCLSLTFLPFPVLETINCGLWHNWNIHFTSGLLIKSRELLLDIFLLLVAAWSTFPQALMEDALTSLPLVEIVKGSRFIECVRSDPLLKSFFPLVLF